LDFTEKRKLLLWWDIILMKKIRWKLSAGRDP